MGAPAAELARWVALARKHWCEFQPRRYRRLQQAGRLDSELAAAARLTADAMTEWMRQGATWDEAWEAVRTLYLFPPEEWSTDQGDEALPVSAAYSAIVEFHRTLRGDDDE